MQALCPIENQLNTVFFLNILFYVYECIACICVSTPVSCNTCGHQKRVLELLELELGVFVSCHLGSENQTRVVFENSLCS